MSEPAAPIRSPDGQWWWDGAAWQHIATLPVAAPVETEWPAWLPRSAAAEAVVAVVETRAEPSAAAVGTMLPASPVAQFRVTAAPRANRPSVPLLVGIGIFGLVAAIVTFTVLSQTGALNGSSSAGPLASPTPAGSEYEQADRFLNGLFSTSINQVAELQKSLVVSCNGSVEVSAACKDSIVSNDKALLGAIAVIDKGPVPACIGPAAKTLRTDLAGMELGLATARVAQTQQGVGAGLIAYALAGRALPADGAALQTAKNAVCAKDSGAAAVPATAAPAPAPTAHPAAVPAGWAVYRNPTWKYSVAYPPGWYQPPADQAMFHYFSNENVSQHGRMSSAGIDLVVHASATCLGLGGGDSEFAPLVSSAKIDVAGQPVTRYFTQFKPPVGSVGGWNADAAVQVGGTCLDIGYFAYSRSVAESLLPTFDLMVASIRPA